jgi:putative acetyltransferase
MSTELIIRPIQQKDNKAVATLIRSILGDMGVPKVGTAYADKSLDAMFEAYQRPKSTYYVLTMDKEVIGCAGIAPLKGYEGNICELQKMYVSDAYRGKGYATKILTTCLDTAKTFGYEGCYLETMPFMAAAQHLYKKSGFTYLKEPLGDTGHTACSVRMINTF